MPTDAPRIATGSCLCRAVRYEITGPMRDVLDCHCVQCRKTTGHFMAATSVKLSHFHLTDESGLAWYHASELAKRGFCKTCGATLFWQAHGRDSISIAAGTLDDAPVLTTTAHIFVAHKGAYYNLNDGLPRYDESNST